MTSTPAVSDRFVLAGFLPAGEVAFGHVDHVTDHVADLPFGAAGLHIPVLGIVHELEKIAAFFADDIQHGVFTAVVHRIDGGHVRYSF